MRLKIDVTDREVRASLEDQTEAVKELLKETRTIRGAVVGHQRIGELATKLFSPVLDAVADEFVKRVGERAEVLYADYYLAKAWAYAVAGKLNEGRMFLDKAKEYRTGGDLWNICQPFYVSH